MLDVGSRIRARRKALHLTLGQLAERSGVSRAMISEIELGRKNPTIRLAYDLAHALETTIAALLDAPAHHQSAEVQQEAHRQVLVDPSSGVERHLLSPALVSRGVHVLLYKVPANAPLSDFPPEPPGVCKHVTVLSGRVEGSIADRSISLGPGDSITFHADVPHGGRNVADEPALLLIVVHDPRPHLPHV